MFKIILYHSYILPSEVKLPYNELILTIPDNSRRTFRLMNN